MDDCILSSVIIIFGVCILSLVSLYVINSYLIKEIENGKYKFPEMLQTMKYIVNALCCTTAILFVIFKDKVWIGGSLGVITILYCCKVVIEAKKKNCMSLMYRAIYAIIIIIIAVGVLSVYKL